MSVYCPNCYEKKGQKIVLEPKSHTSSITEEEERLHRIHDTVYYKCPEPDCKRCYKRSVEARELYEIVC